MILHISVNEKNAPFEVPDTLLHEADEFFARMNADMDRGWQMGRIWVERPDMTQRCQIVADKLATALEDGKLQFAQLLGAYILKHKPGVSGIKVATNGEIQETSFYTEA